MKKLSLTLFILSSLVFIACGSGFMLVEKEGESEGGVNPTPTPVPTQTIEPRGGSGGDGTLFGEYPSIPTNFRITDVGSNYIDLAWTDSLREDGYKLFRKIDGSPDYLEIPPTLPANTTSHQDSGLSQGREYCYKIKAVNTVGESSFTEQECAITTSCSNEFGPEITINNPTPSSLYPSVLEGMPFNKTQYVNLKYAISDQDSCNNSYLVSISLYKHETGELVFSWSDTQSPGDNYSVRYNIPAYNATPAPKGFYDIVIEATDGVISDSQRLDNYFEVKAMPIDSGNPTVVSHSADVSVCPDENYVLSFTLSDDTIPPLGSRWLHTYIKKVGGSTLKNKYNTSISATWDYSRQESPLPADIPIQYYADAYDYKLNTVSNPEGSLINVTVVRDTTPPSVAFNALPVGPELDADPDRNYTISVNTSDGDCPAPVYNQYSFVYVEGGSEIVHRLHSDEFINSNEHTFVIDSSLIGKTGKFRVTGKDSSGNTTTINSDEYTIIPSLKPVIDISIDADPNHPEYFDLNYSTNINIEVISADLTDARIVELKIYGGDTLISDEAYSGPITFPYTTPISGQGGGIRFDLTVSNNGYEVFTYEFIVLGQPFTADLLTNPDPPFEPDQDVTLSFEVNDNNTTGMQIMYLAEYSYGGVNFIFEDPVPLAGHETIEWTTPIIPGSYALVALLKDNEGYSAYVWEDITVTFSASSSSIVFLDYDLSGSMPFDQSVQFDLDANGIDEWTSWLNEGDGYLAIDRNSNGLVDDGNDFARLNEITSGAGDILDSSDALFDEVKIWIDANSDAQTDPGELRSLEEADIIEITLNPCCSFLRW